MLHMSRALFRLAALVFFIGGLATVSQPEPLRLDPLLRALTTPTYQASVRPEQLVRQLSLAWDGVPLPPLHLQPELTPAELTALPIGTWEDAQVAVLVHIQSAYTDSLPGLTVYSRHGPFLTGLADVSRLQELSGHPAVTFVEASRPVWPTLDTSVPEVGANLVWSAPLNTTGEGVVIGVVDTGIDISHPDFRVDRTGDGQAEGTRILALWDQKQSPDGTAARYGFHYGRVYTRRQLENAMAAGWFPSRDDEPAHGGHGTHVAGIAGGGGRAGLAGVAPNADLVVVKSTFYTNDVVDAAAFVFQLAAEAGLPAVANLSLGSHSGPHDGTSNFERAIDSLVSGAGRAVVAAAGNEGGRKIHVGADVRSPTSWNLQVHASTVPVQLWHDGNAWFNVTVTAPSGDRITAEPGMSVFVSTSFGNVWLENPTRPDARNEDKVVYLEVRQASYGTEWKIRFEPVDRGGRVDGWVTSPTSGSFREGDNHSTISEPGNAHRVITVGAYTTKVSWDSLDGPQTVDDYNVGTLSYFSSRGPTRDGRRKPELTAPGAWIAAPRSAGVTTPRWLQPLVPPDYPYRMNAGTSMSAPHVSGTVSLLYSLNPALDWRDLLEALTASARVDRYTGSSVPNHAWGAGKLDAAAAVASLPGTVPPPAAERPQLRLLRNPVQREALFSYHIPPETSSGELQVFDLTGRLIYSDPLSREEGLLRWDLITQWGRLVADGLYLALLVTPEGVSEVQRLVVYR